MRKFNIVFFVAVFFLMTGLPAWSHYGMVIPSDSMVEKIANYGFA